MRLLISTILALGLSMQVAQARDPSTATPAGGATGTSASGTVSKRPDGETAIAECMQMWDAGTHMTKLEWARTCRRVQDRLIQFEGR